MAEIVEIKFGQSLPPERWHQAADHLAMIFAEFEDILKAVNFAGQGAADAAEFDTDAQLALVALRFVGSFASENCRFIPKDALNLD